MCLLVEPDDEMPQLMPDERRYVHGLRDEAAGLRLIGDVDLQARLEHFESRLDDGQATLIERGGGGPRDRGWTAIADRSCVDPQVIECRRVTLRRVDLHDGHAGKHRIDQQRKSDNAKRDLTDRLDRLPDSAVEECGNGAHLPPYGEKESD